MKKIGLFLAVAVAIVGTPAAWAGGPWKILFQDQKMPSQAMLEHYKWATPILGASTVLKSGAALTNGSATTITSFSAQPDYPRNITIGFGGSTGSVGAGTAVVSGTDIFGKSLSENFTVSSSQSTTTTGNKAFKSVSSVVIPAATGLSATVFVGVGNKLGIPRCMNNAGEYAFSEFNGAYETSRGTMAVGASTVSSNTFSPNGTMDGAKPVDLFYVQNFRCYGN